MDALATYPASISGAYGKLRLLDVLNNGGSLAGLNQMATLLRGGIATGGSLREGDAELPRAYGFLGSDAVYVYCDGIETQAQGQSLVDGYLGPRFFGGATGVNSWLDVASDRLYNFAINFGGEGRRWYLNGYSAGAAICHNLGVKLHTNYAPNTNVYITGFGGPAARGEYMAEGRVGGNDYLTSSWFLSDDPVPCIPPRITLWPSFWLGPSWRQRNHMNSFNPLPSGREINLQNNVTAVTLPSQVVPPVTEAIAAWLRLQVRGVANPHSLSTYLGRFFAAQAVLPDGNVPPANAQPLPPALPVNARGHNAQRDAFVDLIVHDARRQNAGALIIPREHLFNVYRQGSLWAVYFGDVQVYISPSKRSARIFKNAANRFLQRFQRGPVVDPGQLISQLTTYLAIASLDGGPIQPILNTSP